MRNIITFFLICIFIISCAPEITTREDVYDVETSQFVTNHHGEIGIMQTYEYLGEKDFSDEKAIRKYHIWENVEEEKYIMIYNLIAKKGTFPTNLQWTTSDAMYSKGMRSAYTTMGDRPMKALLKYNAVIPRCFIMAQEVHVSKDNKEAIFRILIVPDNMCFENYEPVMEELDRVLIINPLG